MDSVEKDPKRLLLILIKSYLFLIICIDDVIVYGALMIQWV